MARSDPVKYETVLVQGFLHVPGRPPPPSGSRHGRKPREPPAPSASDIVLVAIVRQQKEVSITPIMGASSSQYVTRHFQDGRIAETDFSISLVAGYSPDEVTGELAFKYMHKEDVNFTVVALQQMYDLGQGNGHSAYRLWKRDGKFIYLRTVGSLEYRKGSNGVTTLLCLNTLLTEEEGEREIQEMKTRYAASIAKCYQISQTRGPLAEAVSPEYILQDAIPASETPALPSPTKMEEHQLGFSQPSPTSNPALSPDQGGSPGTAQFASMALYSPPQPPLSAQSLPSPPTAHYPGVITGPSSAATSMERPTVLRTRSVITERVSVLTTAGNPSDTCMDVRVPASGDSSERSNWDYKAVSTDQLPLKRAYSLDADACNSKRLHTGAQRSIRQRRRDFQSDSVTEELKVEVSHGPPVLSPEEIHQTLVARGVHEHASASSYRGYWTEISNPLTPTPSFSDPSASYLQTPAGAASLSPTPLCEYDPTSPASLGDIKPDEFLSYESVSCLKSEIIMEALPACLDDPECSSWLGFPDTLSKPVDGSLSTPVVDPATVQAHSKLEQLQLQLQSRMDFQETQISQLEEDLNTVPLSDEPFRSTLSQLQAQHKKQRQMLHTLKQDHHCLQRQDKLGTGPCVKQNLGV